MILLRHKLLLCMVYYNFYFKWRLLYCFEKLFQDVQHMIDINSEHLERLRTPMAASSGKKKNQNQIEL